MCIRDRFLPFDASDTARWVGASVIFALGPLDQLGRHRLPPEWSNYFLLVVRTVIASLLAAAVPLMWYPAAVLLMGIAAGSTTVESPNRVGALTLFSLTSLSAVGLIRGVEHWYLVMAAFAVTMGAHWLWFREWRAERSEVDRRHEEMVDRARMFSWEIDSSNGEILSIAGNTEAVLGWRPEELIGQNVSIIVDVPRARGVMSDEGDDVAGTEVHSVCLLYTSPSPRDKRQSRMPSSA